MYDDQSQDPEIAGPNAKIFCRGPPPLHPNGWFGCALGERIPKADKPSVAFETIYSIL